MGCAGEHRWASQFPLSSPTPSTPLTALPFPHSFIYIDKGAFLLILMLICEDNWPEELFPPPPWPPFTSFHLLGRIFKGLGLSFPFHLPHLMFIRFRGTISSVFWSHSDVFEPGTSPFPSQYFRYFNVFIVIYTTYKSVYTLLQ